MRSNLLCALFFLMLVSCSKKYSSTESNASWIKASKEIELNYPSYTTVEGEENISFAKTENSLKASISEEPEKAELWPPLSSRQEIKKPVKGSRINGVKQKKAGKENNPTAIDAFVLSLLGFLLPPLISAFVLGPAGLLVVINVLGLVLLMAGFGKGIKALKELKQYEGQHGKGFAITAFVLSILGVAAMITTLIVLGVF